MYFLKKVGAAYDSKKSKMLQNFKSFYKKNRIYDKSDDWFYKETNGYFKKNEKQYKYFDSYA